MTDYDYSAMDYAVACYLPECVAMLAQAGAKFNPNTDVCDHILFMAYEKAVQKGYERAKHTIVSYKPSLFSNKNKRYS